MIITVNWQYVVMDVSPATGFRAKRRVGGAPYPVSESGAVTLMSNSWISSPAPPDISYGGRNFIFAFWSLTAHDMVTGQSEAQIQSSNLANDSHLGGMWTVSAKAYYVWDFGSVSGDNAILIDAFDIQLGDFIPDDFVDVTPDPSGTLSADANNGYIDTTTRIPEGTKVTIRARDALPAKRFGYWLSVSSLLHSNDPAEPATVGEMDAYDIVAHYNDIVIAFAFYSEVEEVFRVPRPPAIYNPWWGPETHWGLTPGPPPPPWWHQFVAALVLADGSNRVSPELRAGVLELALRQLSITADSMRKEIEMVRKK
jgi:hypothetical protein